VYPAFGANGPAQLSAMPSVHVAWAVLIGVAIVLVSTSKWRYVFLAHPVITIVVVVVTGNHFWLDGVVGVAVLALAVWFETFRRNLVARRRLRRETTRTEAGTPGDPERSDEARPLTTTH
jgi:membrane-associated phospholipid phosphatase